MLIVRRPIRNDDWKQLRRAVNEQRLETVDDSFVECLEMEVKGGVGRTVTWTSDVDVTRLSDDVTTPRCYSSSSRAVEEFWRRLELSLPEPGSGPPVDLRSFPHQLPSEYSTTQQLPGATATPGGSRGSSSSQELTELLSSQQSDDSGFQSPQSSHVTVR